MLIKIIAYIPAIVGLLLIGLFVFVNNPKDTKNRIFALFNLLTALWLIMLFIGEKTTNPTSALWVFRIGLFLGALFPYMFYLLALVFPFRAKYNRTRQIIYASIYFLFSLLSLTSLNVSSVEVLEFGVSPKVVGPLYAFSDYLTIFVVLVGIVILMLKYRKTRDTREKGQIRIMLFGVALVLLANVLAGIVLLRIVKDDSIGLLAGDFSLLIFSLLVAYAMVKHGLFSIRLIVARTVGYLLSLLAIIGIYSIIVFGILANFVSAEKIGLAQQFVYVSIAVVVALTFPPIKKFFDRLSNKLFYQDAYEPQQLLNELNTLLVSTIEPAKILEESAMILQRYLKPDYVLFHINATEGTKAKTVASGNMTLENVETSLSVVTKKTSTRVLFSDELPEDENVFRKELVEANVSAILQMVSSAQHKNKIGYLILGPKKSGNIYSTQDKRILNIITNELVIAIQNALRFEEIQQFNITLQAKVDDATKQLRRTNEKLKQLDETKDEFISMASHQLRTPLTSMKGYVSMVLEGDSGKITGAQRKLLDQAFVSSQRMVYLIADLLNVSRLRTGKFIIENKPTNLAEVVETELSQLIETAKGRGLELTYNKPKDFPTLMFDETKMRQVIMNFADNAIYYTPSGGHIQVNLVDKGDTIEYTVVDDGLGVPKAEQHHLFTKFFRAGNARKARPDGTGLGLFMAKKVIATQGGAIIFKSEEGKGSTFGFSFPKSALQVPKSAATKTTAK